MAAGDQLDAILGAVSAACEGAGDDLAVNLATLEKRLAEAGIKVKTANRGALMMEISTVRDELRIQRARATNAETEEQRRDHAEMVRRLEQREEEISRTLWPQA